MRPGAAAPLAAGWRRKSLHRWRQAQKRASGRGGEPAKRGGGVGRTERFGEVVVGLDLRAPGDIGGLRPGTHDHHADVLQPGRFLDALADIEPVEIAPQVDVEHHEVRLGRIKQRERGLRIRCLVELRIEILEREEEQLPDLGLVVDDEDPVRHEGA